MKKHINYLKLSIMLALSFTFVSENVAQNLAKIEYPYVGSSTVNYVCIKSIDFKDYHTRIDFVACYTGSYIFLEKPGQRNAMFIRIGNRRYKLQSTHGIASTDRVTLCRPGQLLEFVAYFDPIPKKDRDNFDLIEGIDGTWNFYNVSINKNLSRTRVPSWIPNDNRSSFKKEIIEFPYVERQSSPNIIMMKIEKLYECTKIHFYYKSPFDSYGWVNFNSNTFLLTPDGKKHKILSSEGIPLSPEMHRFKNKGESITFCLIFPPLPNSCNRFSLSESASDGFSFNNVELRSDFDGYLKKCNHLLNYHEEKIQEKKTDKSSQTVRKKLKKDPNFKID